MFNEILTSTVLGVVLLGVIAGLLVEIIKRRL